MKYEIVRVAISLLVWAGLSSSVGCVPATSDEAASASPASGAGPFTVWSVPMRRGPPELLRTDTATGRAWTKGLMENGAWLVLGETPGHEPEPGATGRYEFRAIALRRGAPNLVRTDTETGKVWRKGVKSGGPWVPIPDEVADEPPPAIGVPGEDAIGDADEGGDDDYTQAGESGGAMESEAPGPE